MSTTLEQVVEDLRDKINAKEDLLARLERLNDKTAIKREKFYLERLKQLLAGYEKSVSMDTPE